MKGHCKKCGWPWHAWGHDNEPTHCEKCSKDPMTEFTPLVLFDQVGLNMGIKIKLAVQFKLGGDPERVGSEIREWIPTGMVHYDSPMDKVGKPIRTPGKVCKKLCAWHHPYRQVIIVGQTNSQGDLQRGFAESEFMEMFEPVRFKQFWREGEHGELRDKYSIEKIVQAQPMAKPTGKMFYLDCKYDSEAGAKSETSLAKAVRAEHKSYDEWMKLARALYPKMVVTEMVGTKKEGEDAREAFYKAHGPGSVPREYLGLDQDVSAKLSAADFERWARPLIRKRWGQILGDEPMEFGLRHSHPLGAFKCYFDLLTKNLPLLRSYYSRLRYDSRWSDWFCADRKPMVGIHKCIRYLPPAVPAVEVNEFDLQDVIRAGLVKKPSKGMMAKALLATNIEKANDEIYRRAELPESTMLYMTDNTGNKIPAGRVNSKGLAKLLDKQKADRVERAVHVDLASDDDCDKTAIAVMDPTGNLNGRIYGPSVLKGVLKIFKQAEFLKGFTLYGGLSHLEPDDE